MLLALTVAVTVSLAPGQSPRPAIGERVSQLPEAVWWVMKGSNGDLWFGSPTDGLYQSRGGALTRFSTKDGLAHNHLLDLAEDPAGSVLVSTAGGVSKFDGKAFQKLEPVVSQWPGRGWKREHLDVWLRGPFSGAYRYDGKTLYDLRFPRHPLMLKSQGNRTPGVAPSDSVYSVYRDRSGDIWFGLAEFGTYRYNGRTLDWFYQRDLTETPSGGSIGIRAILQDRAGDFWISNNRNRFRFHSSVEKPGSVGQLQAIKKSGMPPVPNLPHPIYALSMSLDRQGNIWMVTHKDGVWRFDGRKVTHFPVTKDGRRIRLFSMTLDRSGDLWLGTHEDGAYRFDGKMFRSF